MLSENVNLASSHGGVCARPLTSGLNMGHMLAVIILKYGINFTKMVWHLPIPNQNLKGMREASPGICDVMCMAMSLYVCACLCMPCHSTYIPCRFHSLDYFFFFCFLLQRVPRVSGIANRNRWTGYVFKYNQIHKYYFYTNSKSFPYVLHIIMGDKLL